MAMLVIIPIIIVIAIAILMVPFWFILKKAGFSPWLALLCIVPSLGTLVLLYVLAFAEWKVVPAPQNRLSTAAAPGLNRSVTSPEGAMLAS